VSQNQNPEQKARDNIDRMLEKAGWAVQDKNKINFKAGLGVAVREYQTEVGPADYVLFVEGKPVGILEAKKEAEGHHLTAAEEQSGYYAKSKLKHINNDPLPFIYESTGILTHFTDSRDPKPRSRRLFSFHRPETFKERIKQDKSLRGNLKDIPELPTESLRDCQINAINNLEVSFKEFKPRALISSSPLSSGMILFASCLPSSTPHWSNEQMFQDLSTKSGQIFIRRWLINEGIKGNGVRL